MFGFTSIIESKTDVTIQPVDNFKDTFEAFFKKEIETKKNDGDGPFRIWVVGGGKIVSDILESGLKMTFQVTYVPYLLGKGIPLVHPSTEMLTKITSSRLYDGVVEVISEVQKADA
eukprot:TRINITY_DN3862_c0_g1_i2.p1 TRINITY_DN3862_c0_g1~~TRINITY_DN3862_c0_g1_i2.p1  ORF type:complete len:116 (-),score=23.16 TRINITY_DN3862_c0_g1_i2:15-362(-)